MRYEILSQHEILKIIGGLFLVLMVIVFLSWVIKRLHLVNLSPSKGFQSLASITLGPQEKIVLLHVGGRYLLLGTGAIHLLYDFGEQIPIGFDDEQIGFTELLKKYRAKDKSQM